jgi:hypothetical protein
LAPLKNLHKYKFDVLEGMLREDKETECDIQLQQDIFVIATKTNETVQASFIMSHLIAQKS